MSSPGHFEEALGSAKQQQERDAVRLQRVPRILLADDDEDFRALLARVLVAQGYIVVEAEDGDELLDLMVSASTLDADRALAYDAIITDIVMPGFSGLDVLRAFRRATASSAVIVMSGFDDARFAASARSLGAAFFPKPFDSAELVHVLAEAFKFVA